MSADKRGSVSSPQAPAVPPYPAAISISGTAWHSHLAHDRTVPLIHPAIHIGLLETNDVVFTDPAVSRLHAVIEWAPPGYVIRDLGSGTGTLVQGKPISGPTILTPGQHIRIGSTDLYFQAVQVQGAASPETPPAAAGAAVPALAVLPMHAITN